MCVRPLASDAGRPDGRDLEARADSGGDTQTQESATGDPAARSLPRQTLTFQFATKYPIPPPRAFP